MAKKHGNLSISSENIFPIIKKWLYSDHDIFFRELISNGCDAITKLKKLDMMGEYTLPNEYKGKILVTVNPEKKTITFADNGLGMTAEEVEEYINQIAFSGATDFIEKYKDKTSLNLALLSGEIAMVITPNRFVLNNYVKQGFLASLEKLVPELFEENVLIENVVDAARVEGTSYYLPLNFELRVEAIADPGLLKNGKLFETRQEYYDFITENDPEYFQKQTSGEILTSFTQNLDEWIDWKNNTAHFDDGTFEALLEFCSQGSTTEGVTEYMLQLFATVSQWGRNWKVNSFTLTDAVESYRFTDVEKALAYLLAL